MDDDLAVLIATHRRTLTRMAYLMTDDRHLADEAVDSAIERVLVRARVEPISDLLAYLRRAVLNEVTTKGRQHSARLRRDDGFSGRAAAVVPPEDDRSVRREDVRRALAHLPARQRAVIVLRYFADLTEQQVADVLDVHIGTVKSQTAKAMRHLRPLLTDLQEPE